MGIEPTGPAVHKAQPALKAGRHTSTDPLPLRRGASSNGTRPWPQRGQATRTPPRASALTQGKQQTGHTVGQTLGHPPRPAAHPPLPTLPALDAAGKTHPPATQVKALG